MKSQKGVNVPKNPSSCGPAVGSSSARPISASKQAESSARLSAGAKPRSATARMLPTEAHTPEPVSPPKSDQRFLALTPDTGNPEIWWSDYWCEDPKPIQLMPNTAVIEPFIEAYMANPEMSERQLVSDVIGALFLRDHGTGANERHWSSDGCSVDCIVVNDSESVTFSASCSSTWDWKDIYAVSKSSANIKVTADGKFYILNYKYYCSG